MLTYSMRQNTINSSKLKKGTKETVRTVTTPRNTKDASCKTTKHVILTHDKKMNNDKKELYTIIFIYHQTK